MSEQATSAADITLAADFDTPTQADWEREVLKVLNRRRPEGKELGIEQAYKRLTTTTVDGLTIKPLYTKADGAEDLGYPGVAPFTRGTTIRSGEMEGAWQIAQLNEDPDADATAAAIVTDLERGGSAVWLRLDPDAVAFGDLGKVLSGVLLDLAPVYVSSNTDQLGAAKALVAHFAATGADAAKVAGNLGVDPIGYAALHATTPELGWLSEAVELAKPYPNVRPIVVDALRYGDAGAGDIQELGYAIATGTEYVRALIEAGLTPDEAFDAILFRVSATTNQFITMARLRALRTLWSRVGEVLGVSEEKRGAIQHAVTSLRHISRDDAYVNVLRGTIACFAAAAGGAEIQTVLPLDTVAGLPTELTRRIARNTQVLLAEESNVGRVNDPGGGGWFLESMTRQLGEKAWELFGQLDENGMAAAVASGQVADQISETRAARSALLATRKLPLTGVSMFPDMTEAPLERKARPAAPQYAGLVPVRDSQVFEDLRDRSAKAAAAGNPPQVMLACIGARRDFGGREGFTANLFHVGGIATNTVEATLPEDFAAAFKDADTKIAVLCSSAKVYAELGMGVAKALKEAGATKVILAGQLKELGDDDAANVIDSNVFDGMNVVELLTTTLDELEA